MTQEKFKKTTLFTGVSKISLNSFLSSQITEMKKDQGLKAWSLYMIGLGACRAHLRIVLSDRTVR